MGGIPSVTRFSPGAMVFTATDSLAGGPFESEEQADRAARRQATNADDGRVLMTRATAVSSDGAAGSPHAARPDRLPVTRPPGSAQDVRNSNKALVSALVQPSVTVASRLVERSHPR